MSGDSDSTAADNEPQTAADTPPFGETEVPSGGSASVGISDVEASTASTNDDTSALIEVNQPNEAADEAGAPEPANDNEMPEPLPSTGTE